MITPGQSLRNARELARMTIEQLAHASGVSALAITRAEKGTHPLTREDSRKIAPALGMKLHALMKGAA